MRRAISAVLALALLGAGNGSLNAVDAYARSGGSDMPTAVQIGKQVFLRHWPAQILKVYVDAAGTHRVAGLMLSGVKFEPRITRNAFINEAVALVGTAFAAAPVEEVDLWCVVPINVGKGVIVSGDHAQPTQRTVFSVSVRKGESAQAVRTRIDQAESAYWDTLWAKRAFQRG